MLVPVNFVTFRVLDDNLLIWVMSSLLVKFRQNFRPCRIFLYKFISNQVLQNSRIKLKLIATSATHVGKRNRCLQFDVRMETGEKTTKPLCIKDYDVIGFDIDQTLAKYNIPNLFNVSFVICKLYQENVFSER